MKIKELKPGEYNPEQLPAMLEENDVVVRERIVHGTHKLVSAYFGSLETAEKVAEHLACGSITSLAETAIYSLIIQGKISEVSAKIGQVPTLL